MSYVKMWTLQSITVDQNDPKENHRGLFAALVVTVRTVETCLAVLRKAMCRDSLGKSKHLILEIIHGRSYPLKPTIGNHFYILSAVA